MSISNLVARPWLSGICALLGLCFSGLCTVRGASADERQAHFENRIRPILVKHCLECHGDDPSELGGGLSLLSRQSALSGGDTGPAFVPQQADSSLLIQAMRYQGPIQMPPDGRLPAAVVKDFEQWIADGAYDPREESLADRPVASTTSPLATALDHWAFQPLRRASASANESPTLIDGQIDRALAAQGLKRSRPAAPVTLLRRLHYDLTGLPPSPDLIKRFSDAPTDLAYQAIVDELLATADYGRHWGRHWLDVARYADSNGSDFNATFHQAWRYRDYVIDSFNADKPYDQFLAEQIAGDLLPAKDEAARTSQLVATGFLMLGPKMLSERDKAKLQMDVVDDQIDTIGRAMMGLTLGCARCHDHKFDPVPTSDYYALAGIFRSTDVLQGEIQQYVSDWIETPLPAEPAHVAAVHDFETREKELVAAVKQAENRLKAARSTKLNDESGIIVDDVNAKRTGDWVESVYSSPFIGVGYLHDDNRNKGQATVTFSRRLPAGHYRVSVAYTPQANRSRRTKVEWSYIDQEGSLQSQKIELDQTQAPEALPWKKLTELNLASEQDVRVTFGNEGTDGYVIVDAVRFEPIDESGKPIKRGDLASSEKESSSQADDAKVLIEQVKAELDVLRETLARHRDSRPAPLPMAMAVRDSKQIGDTFVCVRGEVSLRGEKVARGFLRVCQPGFGQDENKQVSTIAMPADQSGRLQLAHWICDPDHPLTARVIVNRVWMHLMGEGIVRSVDNFGVLGERPSHPELLDELAIEFLRDGWSIKRLIRRIVLSETYQQATEFDADSFRIDAENRLLWRMNRKRLPAESLRDTLLLASGELDNSPSVAPVSTYGTLISENVADPKVVKASESNRRSVYLPVIRGQVNDLLIAFDFADPDLLVGRRERTTVPSQALMMLNHPWLRARSSLIAEQLAASDMSPAGMIREAYARVYCRFPDDEEIRIMSDFLGSYRDTSVSEEVVEKRALAEFVNALVASSEFRLLD